MSEDNLYLSRRFTIAELQSYIIKELPSLRVAEASQGIEDWEPGISGSGSPDCFSKDSGSTMLIHFKRYLASCPVFVFML